MWNDRNDDTRGDLGPSSLGPALGETSDTETWDRIWRQSLGLATLLAVMIGAGCATMLVLGSMPDSDRYSTMALVLAGAGVPLMVAAAVLARRARRNRNWPWMLAAFGAELVWGAVLVLATRS